MTFNPLPLPLLPKADGKAAVFAQFILAHLPAARSDAGPEARDITLVARSSESPMAQALVLAGDAIAAAGLRVRVIFTAVASDAWTETGSPIPFARDIRWARNPRFIDAHEQLVLAATTSWIGDCMRRDPGKRDAFEQTKPDCASTAILAASSFERLWRVSEPVAMRVPRLFRETAMLDVLAPAALMVPDDQPRRDE
jgi:hypothetical protein